MTPIPLILLRGVLVTGASALLAGCIHVRAPGEHREAGIVVDEQRHAVANATVEIYRFVKSGSSFLPREPELMETVRADGQGRFQFKVFELPTVLVVRKAGLAPGWQEGWRWGQRGTPVVLVLTQPTDIAGRVVDRHGQPVAGAEVWPSEVSCITSQGEGQLGGGRLTGRPARGLFKVRTEADGCFQLDGFPANAGANLNVTKPGMAMREPSFDPDSLNIYGVQCVAGQRNIKLVMEPAAEIEGQVVVQTTGRPLGGVKLWLRRNQAVHSFFEGREPVESASDGTFRFTDVAPGSYAIIPRLDSPNEARPPWVASAVQVTVTAGERIGGVRIPAIKGELLEIAVTDRQSRKPVIGAWVAVDNREYQAAASTGAKGTARFRLPPGDYHFSAGKRQWSSGQGKASVESGRTSHAQIELSPPVIVAGTVRDPSGAPAPNVRVSLRAMDNHDDTRTDSHGKFQITWHGRAESASNSKEAGLPPPQIWLFARDWANNLATASGISPTPTNVDLHLGPPLTLAGKVTDENGKPVADARLGLTFQSRYSESNRSGTTSFGLDNDPLQTDAQGRFEYKTLPQGLAYGVNVWATGYGNARWEVEGIETRTNRLELVLVLKTANLGLSGRVVDTEGKPLAGAQIIVSGQGQPHRPAQTDADGRFVCEKLCAGEVRVGAMYQGSYAGVPAQVGDTNVLIKISIRPPSKSPARD